MKSKFHASFRISLNIMAHDVEDAWEILNAWADCMRLGDVDGLRHLSTVSQVVPAYVFSDVKQMTKAPADLEPVVILDPTVHRLPEVKGSRSVMPGQEPLRG